MKMAPKSQNDSQNYRIDRFGQMLICFLALLCLGLNLFELLDTFKQKLTDFLTKASNYALVSSSSIFRFSQKISSFVWKGSRKMMKPFIFGHNWSFFVIHWQTLDLHLQRRDRDSTKLITTNPGPELYPYFSSVSILVSCYLGQNIIT